jgi:hypothetical protein
MEELKSMRKSIVQVYAYSLAVFALVILLNASSSMIAVQSMTPSALIIPITLIISSLLLQYANFKEYSKLIIGIIFFLIFFFYGQSYLTAEESRAGAIRYFVFLNLLLLIPLFFNQKVSIGIYIAFFLLQFARYLLIEHVGMQINISNWMGLQYVNTMSVLSLFCFWLFSLFHSEMAKILNRQEELRQQRYSQLRELEETKDRLNDSIVLHDRIFETHYKQIEQLIESAEGALASEKVDAQQVTDVIEAIDQHLHEVNQLTQDL